MELYLELGGYIEQLDEELFEVPSSCGKKTYLVQYGGAEEHCTCKSFEFNGNQGPCKHLLMLGIMHARRRRPHSFVCCGCSLRLPLSEAFVVYVNDNLTFEEGQLVCRECGLRHGVI